MKQVDSELDRYVVLLQNKIREKGFTQLEVQAPLGWGRSYISQLVTRQKNLRIDQVLKILQVIGVAPEEFFAELYQRRGGRPGTTHAPEQAVEAPEGLPQDMRRVALLTHGLIRLLKEKGVITSKNLQTSIREANASGA